MLTLLGSRAPAFLAISLPIRPRSLNATVSRNTPVARITHPKYVFRVRRIRVANASGAEEELFIRRHASNPQTKKEKSDEQFGYVTEQKDIKDDAQAALSKAGALPDLQAQPPPLQKVVPATSAPRVSASETKRPQESKNENIVRVMAPGSIRDMAKRLSGGLTRAITGSPVGSQVRMPTGQETITAVWELVAVFAVLMLLRAGVASTLRWIHNRLNATRGLKSNIPYEASVFECMQRPLEFLSLFTVGTALAEAISRPLAATGLLRHIMTLRELGIIFSATWFLLRWIDRIRSRFAGDKRIDNAQVGATSRIATVATFVVSLLISLDTIGINVQTVLAFGGIGGVAIGFAGREIISNFFGGFMVYVTRPFSVGEWVRSIEEEELNGTVEDIGWYLTRVRTWDKRPLYIPNSRFSTLIVENGSRMSNRRILHTLHLRHEDMPVVPQIVADAEKLLMSHPELDPRQHRMAYVDSFDEFSVKLWLSCYTKSVFLYDFRRVQQDILVKFYDIIRARGAKLATRNTRDVRPGADTDRYGPYGSAATFGQAASGLPLMENAPPPAPMNNDVPGAPRYGVPNPMETMHTIESGIDLSRLAQPSVPNGVPDAEPARESMAPVSAAQSENKRKQRPPSNAAVAATAAAFLAARRNAMRKESIEKSAMSESLSREGEKAEKPPSVPEVKNASVTSPGEMKITAAPPRSGATATGASSTIVPIEGSSSGTAEKKGTDEVASSAVPSMGSSAQAGKQISEESLSFPRSVSGTAPPTSAPVGEMKITKARKPKTTSSTPSSGDEVTQPPLPETPPTLLSKGSDDTEDKTAGEKKPSEDRASMRAMQSSSTQGEDVAASSGVMKISAARPSKSASLGAEREKRRDEAEGNRPTPGSTVDISRLPSSVTKETRAASKSKSAGPIASGPPASSGTMKITGTRPRRSAAVPTDSEMRTSGSDTSHGTMSYDSSSLSPDATSGERLSNAEKATPTSQQQTTGDPVPSVGRPSSDTSSTEPGSVSGTNIKQGSSKHEAQSKENVPSTTFEADKETTAS